MGTVLVRNVLSNLVSRGSSILAGLLITPFVLQTLGPERFGFWSLLNTIAGAAVLMDLGLGSAQAVVWTCDFSAEYVRINADYTT